MNQNEHKIADTRGRFAQVVQDGRKQNDVGWTTGRILLSTERLVLAASGGKRTVALSQITDVGGRYDVNQTIAGVSDYVGMRFDENDVVVATAPEDAALEFNLYRALLNQAVVLVRHPAVEGGVVQDTQWEKSRLQVEENTVDLAVASGGFVEIDLDDIGSVEVGSRTVRDQERPVLEVEHTGDETSVQTHVSGTARHCSILETFLDRGEQRTEADIDLNEPEREVLMALYSGVSSFEIPEFVGMDVDEVEEIFERLVELDVLEEVRTRREVALKPRGRNIASDAISER